MPPEQGQEIPGAAEWKAPVFLEKRKPELGRPPVDSPDVGPPIFNTKGIETVVPGTIPLTPQEVRGALDSLDYGGLVFPEIDEPTIETEPASERSILDHDEELPPTPAMKRFNSVVRRLRVPFALLAGALGIGGAHAGVDAYRNFETKQSATESALHEARENVGGNLAEFSEAHKPSAGEVVTLSDGTEMTRGEWTVAVNVANTEGNFLKIDSYGNSWGGNGQFMKDFGTDIPMSAMEDGLHRVQGKHADLSERLSPFFGDNLDSVADSMLRDKDRGMTNEASLKQVIEKTYGASAPGVLAKMEASGTSLHDISESLVDLIRVEKAETLYKQSMDGSGPAKGYDAATMTDAYGSSLRMNDAMYEATAPIVGLTGAEQMKIHERIMTTRGDGGVFHITSTMAGDSVSIGGLTSLEGGVDAKAIQKEMISFGSNVASEVITKTDLANADATSRSTVIEKVQRVLGDQMKLVEAQSHVVGVESTSADTTESVAAMRAAEDKVDLSLKILTAATGNNPDILKMAAEISAGNAKAVEKIILSGTIVGGQAI